MVTPSLLKVGKTACDVLVANPPTIANAQNLEQQVIQELTTFGLSPNEARVFVFLARGGPRKARDVSDILKIHRTETYHLLTALQNRGLVTATFQHPIKYEACNIENALTFLIELQKEKIQLVAKRMDAICQLWDSLPEQLTEEPAREKFQVLDGLGQISLRETLMIKKAKERICLMVPSADIPYLHHYDIMDKLKLASRKNIRSHIITTPNEHFKEFIGSPKLDVRYINEISSHFILADESELLFFLKLGAANREATALWTNYTAFSRVAQSFFSELYNKAGGQEQRESPLKITVAT